MCLSKWNGSDSSNNKINNEIKLKGFIIVTEYSKTQSNL